MLKKLRTYYDKMNSPVKASLWFTVCGFLQKAISMLVTPLFTRFMTETEYGQFATYNSWFSFLQIIVSLNLAAGVYTRGLVENKDDQPRFSSAMLGLSTTVIAFWTVLYFIFHKPINGFMEMSTVIVSALLLDIWSHTVFHFWSNRQREKYRYKKLVVLTLTYVILRPVMSLIAVVNVSEQNQMEARVITTALVNLVLFIGLFITIFKAGKTFFVKKYWTYALKFNLPLVPHYLSQVILNQSDRIMIAKLIGESEAAYYSVAYTMAMVLQILNVSISSSMNPWIYKSIRDGKTDKIAKPSYAVLTLIAVCNFIVVAAAPEILGILAPSSYGAAMWVVPPVTVSVYFMFLYDLFATFEYYYAKTHYVMLASLVGAVLNVLLNLIFIPKLGFVAAGYTTLVCYILYAIAHYLFMRRVCKKNLGNKKVYNPAVIAAIALVLITCSGIVMIFYGLPLIRYGLIMITALVLFLKRKTIISTVKAFKQAKK